MTNSGKIVIIDDEPTIRNLIADFLKRESYEVFTAPDGELGLSVIQKESPGLVLLDVNLAKTSGLDVLAQIKKHCPETVVIMLSGGQDEEIAKKAITLGAYDYITKPISVKNLLRDVIEKILPKKD